MFQEFIEILILSAVQGISEFLPISSSAHLILVSNFYDLKTGSLLIDISLHLGSLFAIIFYFRKDLLDLKNNKKLLQLILLGSIPLIIFGYLLHSTELIYLLRNLKVIAWTTLFFGIVLFFGLLLIYPFTIISISAAIYLLLLPICFLHFQKIKKENHDEISNEDDDIEDVL